jgi:hypothetical protein
MAETLRSQVFFRVSKRLPGRKPMTPAEFVNWIDQHSPPSTPELASLWRAVAEEALSWQRSSAQRRIVPEFQWDTAVPRGSLDESRVV